jgi:hypothetical protein
MKNVHLLLQQLMNMLEVEEVVEDDDENQQNANVVDALVLNDWFVYDYKHDDDIQLLILSDLFQQYDQVQVVFHGEFHCHMTTDLSYSLVDYMVEQELYELAN